MDRTRFLDHLSDLGIPHERTLAELVTRYGHSRSAYYDWDVVYVRDALPIAPGQVEPPNFMTRLQPDLLPPPGFFTFVSAHPDVGENHARTLAYLTERLGAPVEECTSNTVGHRWTFDTAFVSLLSWPPELQSATPLSNPAHDRHPEMRTFAHLAFAAGHGVALRPIEAEWMRTATALPQGGTVSRTSWTAGARVTSPFRGCLRRLPPELATRRTFMGVSADSAALVAMDGVEAFVLPKEHIVGFELCRIAPARGPGGSRLHARYRDPFTTVDPDRSKELLVGTALSSLDEPARFLARWAEKELSFSEYEDD